MKTNLLLTIFAVCLFLSAYTDRSTTQKTTTEDVPESSSAPLFPFRPEEVTAVKIIDQQHCLLVRTTPNQLRPEATEHLFSALTQARIVRRFAASSADLSAYGLDETARRIEVFGASGQKLQTVTIGALNPVGNEVYTKSTVSPDILLSGGYFLTALEFALRQMSSVGDSTCIE
jgi:hypothetical protein